MKWRYINTHLHTGKFNMAYDLYLAKNNHPDEAVLRLYGWEPYCISLGANQSMESINVEKAGRDGLGVVVRPTGGRAILHSDELTYSVIYPMQSDLSAKDVYRQINLALLAGLKLYDEKLTSVELENEQPAFRNVYQKPSGIACFASSARSELKYNGKKLVGSAQRKLSNSILQHGSILTGSYHKKIVNYINTSAEEKAVLKFEINQKTIDLKHILNRDIDCGLLGNALLEGFEEYFNTKFNLMHAANSNKIKTTDKIF